jgi:hypothetical protein
MSAVANRAYEYFRPTAKTGSSGTIVNRPFQTPIYSALSYGLDSVNLDFILTQFMPEEFLARRPWAEQPLKTALATTTITYPIASNSAGNVAAYIFPKNLMASTGLGLAKNAYILVLNDNAFNAQTGAQTPGGT